ncbi:hypothetical protein [Streptomyces sp. NPDC001422]
MTLDSAFYVLCSPHARGEPRDRPSTAHGRRLLPAGAGMAPMVSADGIG